MGNYDLTMFDFNSRISTTCSCSMASYEYLLNISNDVPIFSLLFYSQNLKVTLSIGKHILRVCHKMSEFYPIKSDTRFLTLNLMKF